MNDEVIKLLEILSRLDMRLEQLDSDLNEIKNDAKFKQLIIVILLSSMLGVNLLKNNTIQSVEGLLNNDLPTVPSNGNSR
ncbi:hypothetical protein RHJ63_08390 [Thermosynechococcus sp. JY1334]|uniref:hypothetical protein n=1 Tax=unclassified Thermosynechococcus TaxID=2622553 RepID=UPI002671B5DA|nr:MULTISPECIES: hypothetical protein [unclassified Thermosynechococcus]MDR7898326.1 hypothetical protein [Thermosynechococcus sp. JY1332]MDR7905727.1 hypothetical protein [Thermosynechococcus sp. JY1334]WKT85464.1 hypothetical protein QYC30_08415 [Thermosynechococcus sp. JY1339]WNC54410.1 hypothetical protein RHJ31_08405 [Thermosynechococcus sp. JY1331]